MKLLIAVTALTLSFAAIAFERKEITLNSSNSVVFNQPVREEYVAKKLLEIAFKSAKLSSTQPIYLVLDTPGGSVSDGNHFIDFVKALKRPVHTVVIFAASMGYQITQELGNRYILPSGMLMSHRGAVSGLSGQVPGELNARLGMLEAVLDGMNERAAKRVGMSKEAYQSAIINELWIGGDNAVAKGHADFVTSAKCDSSLDGTYTEEFATIFGPVEVEFSNCPLISGPVGFKLSGKAVLKGSKAMVEINKILNNKKVNLEF
jgi:ATP-dependent protease ClpP protease subunit